MDRVRNEEVHRRARIERELASRADQRVLRCFLHVERKDEYHIAGRVLMAEVGGGWVPGMRETEVRLEGWCEGGLRQPRLPTMHERLERAESPGTYVTE